MFYYLNGMLAEAFSDFAVIDCGGVGYKCTISFTTRSKLPEIGMNTKLFTYMNVREDAVDLFGFAELAELDCFKLLIGVSGVGPKAAIAILSELSPDKFALAVSKGDTKALTRAAGVGAKLASRVVLELKDKVGKSVAVSEDTAESIPAPVADGGVFDDTVASLMALGYSRYQAEQAVQSLDLSALSVENAIRQALKILMKG